MKCDRVQKQLLLGGELSRAACEHLASCPRCRELRAVADSLVQAGTDLRHEDLSPQAIERTRARVDQLITMRRTSQPRRSPLAVNWQPLAAAAVLLLVVSIATRFSPRRDAPYPLEDPRAQKLVAVDIDRRIDALVADLEARVENARAMRGPEAHQNSFYAKASRLRDRIAMHTSEIKTELRGPAVAVADCGPVAFK